MPVPRGTPLATGCLSDGSLPSSVATAVREAAERIDAWTPKGVHFGWESAFQNKGKFPASMSKADARQLVQRVLLEAPLQVFANRRAGILAPDELRVVANFGGVVGTRGQRSLRIIIRRDAAGAVVDNAFPVLSA